MTDAPQSQHDGGLPARSRVKLPALSPRAYEHPAEKPALRALRALSGFDVLLKALSGLFRERSFRLMFLASSVKVSDRQFAEVHRLVLEGCEILSLPEVPEVYVSQSPMVNAMTVGMDRPFIVINTAMLDLMDAEELRFVVGHELGHVLSGHAVYRTMLEHLLALSKRAWMPLGSLGLRAIIFALQEWARKSELSADRAGLLAGQDPQAALRVHMKTAGGSRLHEMDTVAFLEQAREYDAGGDLRDGVLKILNLEGRQHPFSVVRAAELRSWVDAGEYRRILEGDYPRRGMDDDTTWRDDVRAAAQSYRRTMEESADPLMKIFRQVGDELAGVGSRIFGGTAGGAGNGGSRSGGGQPGGTGDAPAGGSRGDDAAADDDPWGSASDR